MPTSYDLATWAAEARRWTRVHARPAPCAHHAEDLVVVGANLARSYGESGYALLHLWSTSIVGHALREDFLRIALPTTGSAASTSDVARLTPLEIVLASMLGCMHKEWYMARRYCQLRPSRRRATTRGCS